VFSPPDDSLDASLLYGGEDEDFLWLVVAERLAQSGRSDDW
jgi:hypothetical protein